MQKGTKHEKLKKLTSWFPRFMKIQRTWFSKTILKNDKLEFSYYLISRFSLPPPPLSLYICSCGSVSCYFKGMCRTASGVTVFKMVSP